MLLIGNASFQIDLRQFEEFKSLFDFNLKDWKKKFKSKLQFYSSLYNIVELNSTFYKIPKESTAEKWFNEAKSVNENFEFIIKVFKGITHEDKFGKESFLYYKEIEKIAKKLNCRILLFQTPKSFKDSKENVDKLIKFLKKVKFKVALELRGFSFETRKEVVKKFRGIYVFDPFHEKINPEDVPKGCNIAYLRLHGYENGKMYYHCYSKKELKWLKDYCERLLRRFLKVYVIFNNIPMFKNSFEFLQMVK